MSSPTARSLQNLRDNGWTCAVVEHWNPYAHIRQDLFGVIDILAMKEGCGLYAIQATTTGNMGARITKSLAEPRLRTWLLCGGRFAVWGWAKRGVRGKRKVWTQAIREITSKDFESLPDTVL